MRMVKLRLGGCRGVVKSVDAHALLITPGQYQMALNIASSTVHFCQRGTKIETAGGNPLSLCINSHDFLGQVVLPSLYSERRLRLYQSDRHAIQLILE